MDEMAEKASVDALDFRLQHLSDSRAVAVLTKLGAVCGWGHQGEADGLHGLGLGFGRYKNLSGYCAVAALIRVDEKITVEKIWAVVDVGLVVNPDGLINQIEGGIVQSLSWTIKEQVAWDSGGITSRTWAEYPIISFSETPEVEVHVIDRPDCLSLGSGEVAAGPVAASKPDRDRPAADRQPRRSTHRRASNGPAPGGSRLVPRGPFARCPHPFAARCSGA